MNCPVCNRNNAVTLSICPSCGAMVHDSVREELIPKVNNAARQLGYELMEKKRMSANKAVEAAKNQPSALEIDEPKSTTTDISARQTSPTLVEFHNKNAAVPEWRLQLQNVVRQRQDRESIESQPESLPAKNFKTNGATALKAEPVQKTDPVNQKNSTLNSALERIQKSRQQFLEEQKPLPVVDTPTTKASKNYPFYIAGKKNDAVSNAPADINQPIIQQTRPTLARTFKADREKLDTNKLPPLPILAPTAFESQPVVSEDLKLPIEKKAELESKSVATPQTKTEATEVTEATELIVHEETEEFDDRAQFAMRFNAGLFDLIIGSFTSLILLSPFILWGGNWLSLPGVFAFIATCSLVMFMYLTTAIGLYGRTIGMRLFSIEIVDVESEDYPTFHQAAVSSSVYLLSLALGGIGFLTLFFNEDRRAVHDLVSGTIIVKE